MTPDPEAVADAVQLAIETWNLQQGRTQQAEEKVLGASDIGFCRQYAALMMSGVDFTDSPSTWPATIGTGMHSGVDKALSAVLDPTEWLFGEHHHLETTTRLPGWEIVGHPDLLWTLSNVCFDVKTKDGLYRLKPTLNNRYQRTVYAIGAQQAGLLQAGPLYAGNIYLDRSGKKARPVVDIEEVTPALIDEIVEWLRDVTYAVDNKEEAPKDVVPMVCERICPYFTVCRGSEDWRGSGIIDDPELIEMVDRYVEVKAAEKEATKEKEWLHDQLLEVSGSTPRFTVRWTNVPPTETRAGSSRLDVRPHRF